MDVLNKLEEISQQLVSMNNRLERLEGHTEEIHSLVPFGRWFESFSTGLSQKLSWYGAPPTAIELPMEI